ncbi:alpha/beta hydrolase family protein [Spirillospora albida]|uniref:alpha/beta hydrolase family protein n=1 Tax=Spirillospora albida TaxID=58123 RepID=UPI001FE15DA0|nr:CocE/NonD family hydrolase [Spirillospora albida]
MKTLAATAALAVAATGAVAAPAAAAPERRGRLLTVRPLANAAALPSAAANRYITYTSKGVGGKRITVSGTVAVPKGTPPRGGWPVLSWAHGTTGTADVCAPSADTPAGPAHDYLAFTEQYLDKWVARGYAVVQTDYEGLGTPGGHPYMNGESHANTVLDIVRAARRLDPRIGRDWFAAGHSQGGQAALFTAAADRPPRDLRLRGAISVAPGSHMSETAAYVRAGYPGAEGAMPFLFVMLAGMEAAEPSFVPDDLLTERAKPLLDAARKSACTKGLRELGAGVPPTEVFRPDADLTQFTAYWRSQEPMGLNLQVPTLFLQGSADNQVTPGATKGIVADVCGRYPKIAYSEYAGQDHRGVINASFDEAIAYTENLRKGGTPPTTC